MTNSKNPKSAPLLKALEQENGFSLNIFEDMSASPIPIRLYNQAQTLVYRNATLPQSEINLVQLAISVENGCEFCVPAHTSSSLNRDKVFSGVVNAIRDGEQVPDLKINSLVNLARAMVRNRGHVPQETKDAFYAQGYTLEHVFEVLAIVSYKTITNYTSALMGTTPNKEHAEYVWKKSK